MLLIDPRNQDKRPDYGTDTYAVVLSLFLSSPFVAMILPWRIYLCATRKNLLTNFSCSIGISYKLAKFYTEYEPTAKGARLYWRLPDLLFGIFKLNKSYHHEDRIEPVEEIVFEKNGPMEGGPMSIT